jgi:hypothetical protein
MLNCYCKLPLKANFKVILLNNFLELALRRSAHKADGLMVVRKCINYVDNVNQLPFYMSSWL